MAWQEQRIRAKERIAAKRIAAGARPLAEPSTDRLPPGQKLVHDFPVLDLGLKPDLPTDRWRLRVDGSVAQPLELDWAAFRALPRMESTSDFHCVTTWSKFDCRWEGVPFVELVERVQPLPESRFVFFTAYDGYTVNVPLDALLDDDVLVADTFDGAPLSRDHGGPVRIIVPKLYAWKGAKWVRRIEFLPEDRLGFWELRGYSNTADPFTDDRFAQ